MLKIQYRDAKDGGIEVLRCFQQRRSSRDSFGKLKEKELRRLVIMHFSAHKRKRKTKQKRL